MKITAPTLPSTEFWRGGVLALKSCFRLITVLLLLAQPAHGAAGDMDALDANVIGNYVLSTTVQPDGKTILAGRFTSVLGVPRNNIARLNADGTLDTGFDPNANDRVFCVAVQMDGKILLGGAFTTLRTNGAAAATTRNRIARVNADGTLDTGFDPNADYIVSSVVVQADDKILLGGLFSSLRPYGAASKTTRNHIARVNADGTLDTGFDPNPSSTVYSVALQADDKILLGGLFTTLQPNGAASATTRNRIARVNADGTLDTGFDPNVNGWVLSVVVQADGKILLGGGFNTLQPNGVASATTRNRIARVNADGTLDPGFNPNASGDVNSLALQADGKILLGGYFTTVGVIACNFFARLLNDAATQTLSAPSADQIIWTRGGSTPEVSRVNFDLSIDGGGTWTPLGSATRVGTTANWNLDGTSLPISGQLRARGRTAGGYVNGSAGLVEQVVSYPAISHANLANLVTSAGALAPAFDPEITSYSANVSINASTLTVTPSTVEENATIQVRINGGNYAAVSSGSASASLPLIVGSNTIDILVTAPDGMTTKTYAITVTRSATELPGDIDPFNANIVGGVVRATAIQHDGKTIIAGYFSSVLGVPRNNIARLNADGTLDMGFDPNAGYGVTSVAVQADGKILLGGFFTSLQPNGAASATERRYIARVNMDGALDTDFDPQPDGFVYSLAVEADGKILVGGMFNSFRPSGSLNSINTRWLARLTSSGVPISGVFNVPNVVVHLAVQADGKILISGPLDFDGTLWKHAVLRLNHNGQIETGFQLNVNAQVECMSVQADGKILLGGWFTIVNGTARNRLARVNANGTLDTGFGPNANGQVYSMAVQSDGAILLGGNFTALHPIGALSATTRNYVARVHADGTIDADFNPNANSWIKSVMVQADGKILLGGSFTTLQPNGADSATERLGFARLLNDTATQTLSVPDSAHTLWTRSGSAPDFSQVTFEQSLDGGMTWTALGTGAHVDNTANWQIAGIYLTSSGMIRAQGRTIGGDGNSSSSLESSTASFSFAPEIAVKGNNVEIADGDATPSTSDHTDFGWVSATATTLVRTFTIASTGSAAVRLTGQPKVMISGPQYAEFTLITQPSILVPALTGATNFQIAFSPRSVGLRSATVSITNDDSDESLYDFSIQGMGDTYGGTFSFAQAAYSTEEGSSVTLTINRSVATIGEFTFMVKTNKLSASPSSQATETKDYSANTQMLTFADGELSRTFTVQTLADTLVEGNETFLVTLSEPTVGAVFGNPSATRVTIIDPSSLTADATAPTLTLATPALNALVGVNTGDSMNLIGTATDAKGVEKVEFKVLTAGGTPAALTLATLGTPGGTSTTFTGTITPVTGTNTVEVKVTDYKGNTKSLTRIFKVTRPLQVIHAGTGTVTAGYAGMSFREVGKPLTITAAPGAGQVFDGWLVNNTTGTGITPLMLELPKLTFTFTEGLVLTAKFIANPFTPDLVGTFNGLTLPSSTMPAPNGTTAGVSNVGLLSNLVLGTKGSFTGSLKIDGTSLSTPGFFDNSGVARFNVTTRATTLLLKRTGKPDIELALNLNMTPGSGKLTGTVTQKLVSVVQAVSNIDADRAHYSTANKVPVALAGTTSKPYTLVFPAETQSPVKALNLYPQGDGYATMTVNVNGAVSLTGKLADDTPITASAPLSKLNLWPIFAQFYTMKGSIAGMAALADANGTTEDVIGTNLQWFRPASTGVLYYPAGWAGGISVDVNGARYVVPPASPATSVFPGLPAVNPTTGNATLTFTGGLLNPLPLSYNINISTANLVGNAPVAASPTMLIDKASGKITGAFIHTDGPTIKPAYQGVIIQKGTRKGGSGYFMSRATPVTGLGESGRVQVLAK